MRLDLVTLAAQKPNEAAALLLGQDIGRVACPNTKHFLVNKLQHEIASTSACPLAHALTRYACKGRFDIARGLLVALLKGIES